MSTESPVCMRHNASIGLIETLRYEPSLGCVRMGRHVERMTRSARYFGKVFSPQHAFNLLNNIVSHHMMRVRLFLDSANQLHIETYPLSLAENIVWTVAIARTKLDAHNPYLVHKTDQREIYERARAEFTVDEVLLTNQYDYLCEGTITSLFVKKNNILVTPPLSDGLLCGVLRQELIEDGKAIEDHITVNDLKKYPFFVGNSLRGPIQARLFEK